MRSIFFAAMTLALVAGLAGAQGPAFTQTLPKGFDTVDGNFGTSFPFNTTAEQRWQWVYDWSEFQHQSPITINSIALRPGSNANTVAGGTYPNVTILMASSTVDHTFFSSNFAGNLGIDQVVVYQGPLVIPPVTGGATGVAPWLVTIPLQTSFAFDPTRRADLIVDIQTLGPNPAGVGLILDGATGTPWGGRHGVDAGAATLPTNANFQNFDSVPLIRLDYVLGSFTHFYLNAFTSGQDLSFQYLNVPANTARGYTLISVTPSPILGRGPVLGLTPDAVTFSIVLRPPGLGDPLHWQYPAFGTFPDIGLFLPPGAFASFIGQTWEFVGVAIGPAGTLEGVTQAVALTF